MQSSDLNIHIAKHTGHGHSHPVFWPGACPHCQGDLQLCEDQLGPFRKCITCGRTAPEDMGPGAVSDMAHAYTAGIPGMHRDLALETLELAAD